MSRCVEMRRARPLLGTFVDVTAQARKSVPRERGMEAAFRAIGRVHGLMNFHNPGSELSRLNRLAHLRPISVHAWTFRVLRAAQILAARTDGAFDVTTDKLVFGGGWRDIILDGKTRTVMFRRALAIDLGGIAKGFAVDRAVEALQHSGVQSGIVNAGGDLRVFGARRETIGVRHFGHVLHVREQALATSAWHSYPGPPSKRSRLTSISVTAPTAMIADALTKVVFALGQDAAHVLRRYSAKAVILQHHESFAQDAA
jgi:thiamine biosynthesis lipoprotein